MATHFMRPFSLPLAHTSSLLKASPVAASATRAASRNNTFFRTMSSSAPVKAEWLAIVPDKPNTLAKRLEVRPIHFANLEATRKTGAIKFGGAILSDAPSDPANPNTFDFKGSSLILEAASKAEVIEFLKTDVYHKEGVWDIENAQIYYLKTAMREQFP